MNETLNTINSVDEQEEKINLIALGNNEVGKTSFILRYVKNEFSKEYLSSIGFDFQIKSITIKNKSYKIYFYDTAGQEKFRAISFNMIKYSDGIVLMYDITNKKSFDSISQWIDSIKEIKEKIFPLVLIGNKCDLEEKREVTEEEGKKIADKFGFPFFETSNKNGTNIEKACTDLIDKIIERNEILIKSGVAAASGAFTRNSQLTLIKPKNNKKKCGC